MRHSSVPITLFAVLVLEVIPLAAQYPGQYPPGQYPPGQYPGGQSPGQSGPGIPFPRRKKKTTKDPADEANLKQITGTLRQLQDKSLTITADDTRNINFKRADTTKFLKKGEAIKPETLKPGDHVMVEANQDDEGYMYAVRVNLEKEGTAAEREKASAPVPMIDTHASSDDGPPKLRRGGSPAPAKDDEQPVAKAEAPAAKPEEPAPASTASAKKPDPEPVPAPDPADRVVLPVVESDVPIDETDPGAPKLRRGGPVKVRKAAPERQVASIAPPASNGPVRPPDSTSPPSIETTPKPEPAPDTSPRIDPRIEKAREAVATFTESLPSYVCQEQIARYVSTTHKANWTPLDIVSTEVVYEHGKEDYRNLQVNGKPVKKTIEEIGGSWSKGEFGTVLVDLFSPSTAADFRYRRTAKASGRDAFLYDFEVEHETSHWHIQVASQSLLPAYKGSVWIDKETNRVLRIEMQAVQVPKEFPLDKIEMANDYQFIRIGDRQFLLPVHSEVLDCQRGTDTCTRNAIDFRNYHRYSGDSSITFENK